MFVKASGRLEYIDWMRGLACILMFQTHCYDSWLRPAARAGHFYRLSQLGGTLPAPIFIFLAGVSSAFVTERLRAKGLSPAEIVRKTFRRGALIFGAGLLFRLQEFALGWPGAPWTDLLRPDVLNILGLSMMLMALLVLLSAPLRFDRQGQPGAEERSRWTEATIAAAVALLISLATPPLWTTHRPRWLPWFLESYINGVHIYNQPQSWLFPLFPWAAFAFAGLAVGFALRSARLKGPSATGPVILGVLGAALGIFALWWDARPGRFYSSYDFWRTSPSFFLLRTGLLLVILFFGYAWCRWGLGASRFRPLIQLGNTSLLVYWVHIEFVYGRFSILAKKQQGIRAASVGLLVISFAMLALSVLRTWWKSRGAKVSLKYPAPAPAP